MGRALHAGQLLPPERVGEVNLVTFIADKQDLTFYWSSTCSNLMQSNSLGSQCRQKAITDASQLPLPRRVEKENLAAFIAKKREIFMVQMSLDIKQQEMQRLAQRAAQVRRCPMVIWATLIFPTVLCVLRKAAADM